MKQKLFIVIGLALTLNCFATTKPTFSMKAYQQCRAQWTHCHKTGPYYSSRCVTAAASHSPGCHQTSLLAKQLRTSIDTLTIHPIHNFFLVTQRFYADGQLHYYLLTPKKKLVDTLILPKPISKELEQKLGQQLFLVNTTVPRYQKCGVNSCFIAALQVRQGCLACKPLSHLVIRFVFSPVGELLQQQLLKLSTQQQGE